MREVIFKHLISTASRKKDIVLREILEKDGVIARTERRCFYLIKDIKHLDEEGALQKWLDSQGGIDGGSKRKFHVLKEHNDANSEDKVVCRISGTFFVVVDKTVFTIGFIHSLRVRFMKGSMAK